MPISQNFRFVQSGIFGILREMTLEEGPSHSIPKWFKQG